MTIDALITALNANHPINRDQIISNILIDNPCDLHVITMIERLLPTQVTHTHLINAIERLNQ